MGNANGTELETPRTDPEHPTGRETIGPEDTVERAEEDIAQSKRLEQNPLDQRRPTPAMDTAPAINAPINPAMTVRRLLDAVKADKLEQVRALMSDEFCDINAIGEIVHDRKVMKHTALTLASLLGHLDVVRLLLTHAKILVNLPGEGNGTSLHFACRSGHGEIAIALLHLNANPNAMDQHQMTPLQYACKSGNLTAVHALLRCENINVNSQNKTGTTPLHEACRGREGGLEMVSALLECADIFVNPIDRNQETPFHLACIAGNVNTVLALLENNCVDVNAVDLHSKTGLLYASEYCKLEIVRVLVNHGTTDVNKTDDDGYTALHVAAQAGSTDIVEALLDSASIAVNRENNNKMSALDVAILETYYETAEMILRTPTCICNRIYNGPKERQRKVSEVVQNSKREQKLLLECMDKHLTYEAAMKLLLLDLPVELNDGHLVTRSSYSYSWTTFMDVSRAVSSKIRIQVVQSILAAQEFSSVTEEFLHEMVFAKDQHGREVIQITDQETRKYLYDLLFFCGRYQIFGGPPVHVSNTAVVVMAYDHGICEQVFDNHAQEKDGLKFLNEKDFVKCSEILGRLNADQTSNQKKQRHSDLWKKEFQLWDKDNSGSMEKDEFLRYCAQYFGGKLKVAMKFMRNKEEYDREHLMRKRIGHDHKFVLQLLPSIPQAAFQEHTKKLNINGEMPMTDFQHVLVMPSADRSLEDIYLKERPDEIKTKSLLQDVLHGLAYLHDNHLVHADLKKLNVLRVQSQIKLIDFDAAVRNEMPLGAKFSSGILPPEMFYELANENDNSLYKEYWGEQVNEVKKSSKKLKKSASTYVVKAFKQNQLEGLPYELEKAKPSIDMWSFGCMMYQMIGGSELVPTDINQNVVSDSMVTAATWTDETLHQRIDTHIAHESAKELLKKLLVVDPLKRLSAKDVLEHRFFTGKDSHDEIKSALEFIHEKHKVVSDQADKLSALLKESDDHRRNAFEETKKKVQDLGTNVMTGTLEAHEVTVPSSFVVLPFKLGEEVERTRMTSFVEDLNTAGDILGKVSDGDFTGVVSKLCAGEPLYLYLVDEFSGEIVLPSPADTVYPIVIPTKESNAFIEMTLPWIQSGFNILKSGYDGATWIDRLNDFTVLQLDEEERHERQVEELSEKLREKRSWMTKAERSLHILSQKDAIPEIGRESLHLMEFKLGVRGTALRDLKNWFQDHDKTHSFGGLRRVISSNGTVVWTTDEHAVLLEQGSSESHPASHQTPGQSYSRSP
ncbi:Aste57867_12433 [Aphanomyces stellatus]|uniref:Aste57867_12433 protein n=1 Tax=Aphanomyces stellatus TaxID=120398 RepID=A0A485KVI4_9STRA|nr:hypothetical protein As57867_012387 [Aphanomyces stellatus]VFT89284.1 Aste57867_12433 [Aphanomyces stellatus]